MNTSYVPDENKEELSESSSVSPLSDFVFSLFWIALGCLIMLASWQMDRLEGQGSSLYTAPGSYPGLLGGVLLILGVFVSSQASESSLGFGKSIGLPKASAGTKVTHFPIFF